MFWFAYSRAVPRLACISSSAPVCRASSSSKLLQRQEGRQRGQVLLFDRSRGHVHVLLYWYIFTVRLSRLGKKHRTKTQCRKQNSVYYLLRPSSREHCFICRCVCGRLRDSIITILLSERRLFRLYTVLLTRHHLPLPITRCPQGDPSVSTSATAFD